MELSRVEDVREITPYRPRKTMDAGLRSVKGWKSTRDRRLEKPVVTSEADGPVARKSTRRKRKEGSRRTSVKSTSSPEELLPQSLTAPRLKALESEITRSSSLEMEISTSPKDALGGGESVGSQTSESAVKQYSEQSMTKIEIKAASATREAPVPQAPSIISKRSGSWKEALRSVRDSFMKKPSTATESSLSTKVSNQSAPLYEAGPLKSIVDNLTPDSPVTSYLTAPDVSRVSVQSLIPLVQGQVSRLEVVASDAENENTLPSDVEQQMNDVLNVEAMLQEVSGPSLSRTVEDPNTLSGVGELVAWDSSISRKQRARAYKSISKQRRAERRPVGNAFRAPSPVLRRESPLKPISPLRVVKDKIQTNSAAQDYTELAAVNPSKSEPGALLTRVSMETLTSFKELSLPSSLGSSSEVQKEVQASKEIPATIVKSTFESLTSLATPPPVKPPQEVRSPTLMREMAFPSLRLRDGEEDTPVKKKPLKRKMGLERNSIPKKVVYGDTDWRTDRRISGNSNINETYQKLQELQEESSISSYDGQRTSSMSGAQEPDFTALPKQNYIIPLPEANSSSAEQYGGVGMEPPFLKYTVNPPLPAGTSPPVYPLYQGVRDYRSRTLTEGTSIIDVGGDGQDEPIKRGRRRTRTGS